MQPQQRIDPDALLAEDMGAFFYDPLGWVMYAFEWGYGDLQGYDGPDEWQRLELEAWGESIRANNFDGITPVSAYRSATSSGHGIGKSAFSAWVTLYIMSTRPHSKGVVTSNTSDQLRTKTWGELGKWKKRCITGHWFEYNNGKGNMNMFHKEHKETWRVDGQTCREENSESFAGLHAANSSPWYLFDEASAVPDKIWEVAEGGLTDGEPFWFAFGNPTRNSGRFHDCFTRYAHRWNNKTVDSRKAKMTNKALISEWEKDYGQDSDFFRVRVRGMFPRASSLQLIPNDWVAEAMRREAVYTLSDALVCGIDIARGGDDNNVIRFRRGLDARTIPPIKIPGSETRNTTLFIAKVCTVVQEHKPDAVFVDSTGVGGPVADQLRRLMPGVVIIDINFASAAPDAHHCNMRTHIWWNMREALRAGLAIEDDSALERELTAPEYGHNARDQLALEKKSEIKKRLGISPDDGDALALTFAFPVMKQQHTSGASAGGLIHEYDPMA
jgi:hypothetical protein